LARSPGSGETGHQHFPDLSGSTHALVHSAILGRGEFHRRFSVVAGVGLPIVHRPFSAWLMMGFFKAIPKDVEEAAMVDGYSRLGAFFRVVVPISFAGILTVAIFSFTLVMQEFVYAVTFISSVRNMTVSVGVPTFLVHGDVYFWGSLMAGCFIASVPVAILYNYFVDRFIAGFTIELSSSSDASSFGSVE
jgi:ABC-type glycerol-3-phosphate transport system permease component